MAVLPENQDQVVTRSCSCATVMRYRLLRGGAATGLSGGALPLADGLLPVAKFNRILDRSGCPDCG